MGELGDDSKRLAILEVSAKTGKDKDEGFYIRKSAFYVNISKAQGKKQFIEPLIVKILPQ